MSVIINSNENGKDSRKNAILNCYGAKAFASKKSIVVENEEITHWLLEGYLELEDLQEIFTDEQIVDIYDSGE